MGKKSGGNEARLARQDEQARQQRIREGTKRIGEIFEGGSPFGTGQLTGGGYDPSKKYYTSSGAEWTPKIAPAAPAAAPPGGGTSSGYVGGRDAVQPGGGGVYSASSNSGGGYQQTPRATAAPAAVNYGTPEEQFAAAMKAGLFSGVGKSTGAFSGDFFDKRRQAYVDYAMPQLQDQYKDAQRELTYSLARGGNLASSTNAVQTGDLSKLYGTNQQAIADKALGYSNEARTAVEDVEYRVGRGEDRDVPDPLNPSEMRTLSRSQLLVQPPFRRTAASLSPLRPLFPRRLALRCRQPQHLRFDE
jgi:hypothetical protein